MQKLASLKNRLSKSEASVKKKKKKLKKREREKREKTRETERGGGGGGGKGGNRKRKKEIVGCVFDATFLFGRFEKIRGKNWLNPHSEGNRV